MLKKTLTLTMIYVFLLSLLCVGSVSATVTTRIIDDFEAGNVGQLDTLQSGSPENGRYYISDNLFVKSYNTYAYHFSLDESKGYNNSTGLYLHADVTSFGENAGYRGAVLQTKTFETTAEKSLMISHRYKLLEEVDSSLKLENILGYAGSLGFTQEYYPSGNNSVARFRDNGGNFIDKSNGATFGTIAAGEWYTFTYTVTGAGNIKTVTVYITDEDGNPVGNSQASITLTSDTSLSAYPFYFIPVATQPGATKDEIRIVVDDFVVTEYTNTDKASLDASRTSVAEGETDVAIDRGIALRFDRPVSAPSEGEVTLYKTEDPNKTPVDIEISKNVLDGFTVTPTEKLDTETDYTLSFADIKNSAGTEGVDGADTLTFTTEKELRSAAVENGEASVKRNQELSFTFSKDLTEGSTLILKKNGSDTETPTVKNGNKLTLNYSGLLDKKATYTVEFTNVKYPATGGDIGCTVPSISFTTEDTHIWNTTTISNVAANGIDAAKTDITFKLEDSEAFGYGAFSGTIIAVRYGEEELNGENKVRKMVKFDLQEVSISAGSSITKTFNLGGALTTGEKVQLILIDTDGTTVPLSNGEYPEE